MEINSFWRERSLSRIKINKSVYGWCDFQISHISCFVSKVLIQTRFCMKCFDTKHLWCVLLCSCCSEKSFSHDSLKSGKRRLWTFQITKELYKRFIRTKVILIRVKWSELSFVSWACYHSSITRSWAAAEPAMVYCKNHSDSCISKREQFTRISVTLVLMNRL